MNAYLRFILEIVGYWVTVLIIAEIFDHRFHFADWNVTLSEAIQWFFWAIVLAAITTLRSHRRTKRA